MPGPIPRPIGPPPIPGPMPRLWFIISRAIYRFNIFGSKEAREMMNQRRGMGPGMGGGPMGRGMGRGPGMGGGPMGGRRPF